MFRFVVGLLLLSFVQINSAQCTGSFGEPIFTEDFGVMVGNSVYAPPLSGESSTTYTYVATNDVQDGQYTITTSPVFALSDFHDTPDSTEDPPGETGNMLVVNADFTPGEFYRRNVSDICNIGGSTYRFRSRIMNVNTTNILPINVRFEVQDTNGNVLGFRETGDIFFSPNPTWLTFSFDFELPVNVSDLVVILRNNAPGGIGNDLAIDDITFQLCGDELTIDPDIDIFSGESCNVSQVNLTANLGSNSITNADFNWEISTDSGNTWQNLPCNGATCTLSDSDYANGDRIRYSVIEIGQSENCRLFSNPVTVNLFETINPPPNLQEYSITNEAEFNLNLQLDFFSNQIDTTEFNIQFFESMLDIQNNNPITNPANYLSEERTVLVRLEKISGSCIQVLEFDLEILEPLTFEVCDVDEDGIHTVSFQEISTFIEENILPDFVPERTPVIFMAAENDGIVRLESPGEDNIFQTICNNIPGVNRYFELAVNNREEMFLADQSSRLIQVDLQNCNSTLITNLPNGFNTAMSFDTQNNLYVGALNSSRVLVGNEADNYQNFQLWHDFQQGTPAGDFIELNGKLYISWNEGAQERLYEVTIDEDMNYVSHIDLGQLPNRSFGMAGDLGILYGVTTEQVYRIDLDPFDTVGLFNNPTTDRWFGAAGLREASVEFELYFTQENAMNQQGQITNDFQNTNPFDDFVWIRIERSLNNVSIVPLRLNITPKPALTNFPPEISVCNGSVLMDSGLDANNYTFEWLKDGDVVMGETNASLLISEAGTYQFIATENESECTFDYSFVATDGSVEIIRHQVIENDATFFVDNPTELNGLSLDSGSTFDSDSEIPNLPEQIYEVIARDNDNCLSEPYEFEILDVFEIPYCDPDGDGQLLISFSDLENQIKNQYQINLSDFDLEIYPTVSDAILDAGGTQTDFTATGTTELVYRLEDSNQNIYIQQFELVLNNAPQFELDEEYLFCVNDENSFANIDTGLTGNFSYQWFLNGDLLPNETLSSISVRIAGNYQVVVSNLDTNCETTQTTVVMGSQVVISSVNVNGSLITVNATGGEMLEYKVDNQPWQLSNQFILENGDYQFFVRNEIGCESVAFTLELFFISNFISPNDDGLNDTWEISNIHNFPNAALQIYDRYGKLIYETQATDFKAWDGTYLGSPLPSGSYWYTLLLDENRVFSGSILVKYE